jgi:hypothetical protein
MVGIDAFLARQWMRQVDLVYSMPMWHGAPDLSVQNIVKFPARHLA